jgi:hypothetical protein
MTEVFSFARLDAGIARAVQEGARDAAGQLAESFRAEGEQASVQTAPDGSAQIVLEGAATVAREFGTRGLTSARPVIGTTLAVNRQAIRDAIARKIANALKGGTP